MAQEKKKKQSACESWEAAAVGTLAWHTTWAWLAVGNYLSNSETVPSRLSESSTSVVKVNWALKEIIPERSEEFINLLHVQRS